MTRAWPFPLHRLKRIFLVYLGLWLVALFVWWNNPYSLLEKNRYPGLPFGFVRSPEGSVQVQDFAYNLVFFRGIQHRIVAHPYRLADQEKMVRTLLPAMTAGLSHGYSPVAYVLAWPLLRVTGAEANFIYEFLCTVGIIILLRSYLLPRMESFVQLYGFALCAASICLALAYALGQSSLLTTTVLAAFWVLLQRNSTYSHALMRDAGLAVLFWILCLKPSVAIIPFVLLVGVGAWRALLISFLLLGVTWLVLAPLYGGWVGGLRDYSYLLNHYNNSDFTPFMRRDYRPGHDFETRALFTFDRWMSIGLAAALIALRWLRHVSLSEMFQGLIASFLLFSPYLLPSEDWILCLLLVEGRFFRDPSPLAAFAKLLILFGIMDLRGGTIIPWEIHFQLKCVLFGWMLFEALLERRRGVRLPEAVA